MALDNLIAIVLPPAVAQAIGEALTNLREALKTFAINLTPAERRQYGRIADGNKTFVDKCRDYMQLNPSTIPAGLDVEEFERDYQARKQLEGPARELRQLLEQLEDTKTLLDHDNYTAAITYYRYVKFLAGINTPGMTAIADDLKKHFQRKPQTVEPDQPGQPNQPNQPGQPDQPTPAPAGPTA